MQYDVYQPMGGLGGPWGTAPPESPKGRGGQAPSGLRSREKSYNSTSIYCKQKKIVLLIT